MAQPINDQLLERVADRFRAMSNPLRLKILHELEQGELSVSEILARIGGSQANVSKQLAVLRHASLVASRREGPNVYYRICDPAVLTLCEVVCDALHEQATDAVEAIEQGRSAASLTSD